MSIPAAPAELPKTYDPSAVEAEAYRVWLEEKCFQADPAAAGEPYCIVIPPPNVTGALHLGHAINNTLQDILIRRHRMAGFNTLWIPGIDHAGIATQAVVEKQLKEQQNKTRHDVGREGLVERIWVWKQQYGDRILNQLQRLGASCDWSRTHFTLDDQCARAVRETFFKLFRDGLIYRGKRLVNWDVHLQTSISDDEIYHETVKTFLWHIRYPISPSPGTPGEGRGEGDFERNTALDSRNHPHPNPLPEYRERGSEARPTHMTVATTRPETLLGDTAVAVHSQDPRWNWAIGRFVELPLTGRRIPIIADDILVDPKFGSGVVKVTPAHDPNDYAVYQRHLGQPDAIDIINILNPDGTLNAAAGAAHAGMKRDPARKKVVEDLKAAGLLVKEEPYETQVGHSDRSKTAVEPYLSDQWFVKMAPLAEPALKVVEDGTIQFFPERHRQQYLSWLGEKRDWPISRQLWWGHRIPVWTLRLEDSKESHMQEMLKLGRLVEMAKSEPNRIVVRGLDEHGDKIKDSDTSIIPYVCTAQTDPDLEQSLQAMGFVQDPDVLDTWFSSALWPHSTLGWPDATADLAKWYPTSVLLTGRDIITLWVARMVMMGMYNMGTVAAPAPSPGTPGEVSGIGDRPRTGGGEGDFERITSLDVSNHPHPNPLPAYRERGPEADRAKSLGIPFHHVAINPTILDGRGERMSKSKGNGVDPVDIIDTHGADALRFTLTTMATETQDVRLPVKKLASGKNTSEKFDLGRNFCNKLWNAARFALANLAAAPSPGNPGEGGGEGDFERTGDSGSRNHPHPGPLPEYRKRGPDRLSLADRWILSRFTAAVAEADAALAVYRFDQYAKTCYDFFWRDFCDWYVEAIKPAMKDANRAAATASVLAAVLDGALRLMHPIIPFITETIWWQLNAVRPSRGIPGLLDCPPSRRLIHAAWPRPAASDESADHVFPRLQAVVVAIRNVRNEYKVDPKKPMTVVLSVPGAAAVEQTEANREMIELLASCAIKRIGTDLPQPPNAARGGGEGFEVFALNLIDPQAGAKRLARQREELARKAEALRNRLANPSYAQKAPAALVQQTRDELAAVEAELVKLG